MFFLLGLFFVFAGIAVQLVAVVWQIIVAFKTGETATWGVLSIFGVLCLMMIPNLLWIVINWDRGWPMLVAWLGALPAMVMGYWLLYMEFFSAAAASGAM